MDPISQATVGAAAAQTSSSRTQLMRAAIIGALAGMAPDLDIFIRSSADPLLALEYHRHFTHALIFIPFGAAICAVLFYFFLNRKWQLSFKTIYLWCFLGYATHGLLDGCTTYGTRLLWPFSDVRIAWNTISVIDPLFTLPVLAMLVIAIWRQSRAWHIAGVSWMALYLCAGLIQNERAEALGHTLAQQRSHTPINLKAKPGFANIIVWKTVYEYEGRFYVDAVRPGLLEPRVWEGSSITKFEPGKDFNWLTANSQQAKDIERFSHFSSGFVAIDPFQENSIVDVRYSQLPHQIDPMWGIRLYKGRAVNEHAEYFVRRDPTSRSFGALFRMFYE